MAVTEHSPADDEKAPPQVAPAKPGSDAYDDKERPPADQPPGQPQHDATNPDDD
jgi:hypothetical protein